MRYEWLFDTITDIAAFAFENRFFELAEKAEELMQVARIEVARAGDGDGDGREPGNDGANGGLH